MNINQLMSLIIPLELTSHQLRPIVREFRIPAMDFLARLVNTKYEKLYIDLIRSPSEWTAILTTYPQFIDDRGWDNLDESQQAACICADPMLIDKYDVTRINGYGWASIINAHPQFASICPWDKLNGDAWVWLLNNPEMHIHCKRWHILDGTDWARLLSKCPQFAHHCDWAKLSKHDWTLLLSTQPHFSRFKPKWWRRSRWHR
jgi:hypothetical protein